MLGIPIYTWIFPLVIGKHAIMMTLKQRVLKTLLLKEVRSSVDSPLQEASHLQNRVHDRIRRLPSLILIFLPCFSVVKRRQHQPQKELLFYQRETVQMIRRSTGAFLRTCLGLWKAETTGDLWKT